MLAALPFLPDRIPAHYNAAGAVNRWGSRYETLIFPLLMLPYGALWLGVSRLMRNSASGKIAELLLVLAGIVQFAVFDLIILYFLYADFRQAENLAALPLDLNRSLCAVSGLGLIALGNWIPKLKKPGPAGLRTPWSVKNEAVWRKCQRFGGWAMAAAGGGHPPGRPAGGRSVVLALGGAGPACRRVRRDALLLARSQNHPWLIRGKSS